MKSLITNGLIRLADDTPLESLPARSVWLITVFLGAYSIRERQEDDVFRKLLRMCHGLEERLLDGSDGEVALIADWVSP